MKKILSIALAIILSTTNVFASEVISVPTGGGVLNIY